MLKYLQYLLTERLHMIVLTILAVNVLVLAIRWGAL